MLPASTASPPHWDPCPRRPSCHGRREREPSRGSACSPCPRAESTCLPALPPPETPQGGTKWPSLLFASNLQPRSPALLSGTEFLCSLMPTEKLEGGDFQCLFSS